jgi:ABC-type cobalamin/Fe3+-siderophores transport system ATPase subunit
MANEVKTNDKNSRGSIWRKWDLHLHTPETKLNNQYPTTDKQDVWDLFCEKIESSDVSVFGITDYFSVENYFTFVEKFKTKYPNSKKVFFPNIEFRIESKNSKDEHIQFHIIFSNSQITLNKLNNFFTRLKLVSTDNENLTNKYCTSIDLSSVGYDKAMVKIDELEEKLQNDFTDDEYLIVGVANGYGSLRPNCATDGRGSEYAKELDKKCKLFFGSSKNTNFFLNKDEGRNQYNLPPKPVVFGCDSHSFDILEKKLGKSFEEKDEQGKIKDYAEITWIKGDQTFEGLKQIVYEPVDRVKIQELEPESEKEDYQIIDKVKFIDNSQKFSPNDILLNKNLTTIIGGKSTGKSILLREVARAIDKNEVENRLKKAKIKDYDSVEELKFDFVVTWKDKQENKKNEDTGVNKKIIYIPQSYLNRLTDEGDGRTPIFEIIKNVLEQEEDVKSVFTQLQNQNREIEKIITQNIEDLFYKENDIKNLSENIKKIGDKKGIESEIEKLKKEVSELKKKAGMSDDEISAYNETLEKITNLKATQERVEKNSYSLATLKSQKNFSVFSATQKQLDSLEIEIKKSLQNNLNTTLEEAETKWKEAIEQEHKILEKQKTDNQIELENLYKIFNPLLEKAQKSKSLDEKIKKLEEEEKKLKEIIDQEKNLGALKTSYSSLIKTIADNHSKFFDNFFSAKTKILNQRSITKDQDLEFGIEILFESKTFQENCINDICDQRKLSKFEEVVLQDYSFSNSTNLKIDIEKIIQAILSEKLTLKSSYSKKEAITRFTQSWFVFDYKIKQNGDEISEMSPGKKSFVLLKLLIELDNSKCPILLDQPEDDLDNRSIYNDLVKFIKTKKKERQIIIATHNPNLVVGADSECVIVANQKGDKSENKTYQFEYVQGALENTFLNESSQYVLEQRGIQEHVCDILEGGKIAFEQRKKKYNFI